MSQARTLQDRFSGRFLTAALALALCGAAPVLAASLTEVRDELARRKASKTWDIAAERGFVTDLDQLVLATRGSGSKRSS